ncbi:putative nucleotidyltransferase, Ribonuclease H [Helianthus annuus]|uniref:Nucleotidyltransferase, Ribonuclease H n=1 Tax=Helianthus annuus TaxID=4232 RepID=A0A9K3IFG2_HELAN|nr:putative nucleotidyltransferase, Ribonuclease H [Helianthus annuus]KAJ0901840.1 putative nucleotidyltransferase, Ribonuclease H [Helianthus annuus]
MVTKRGIEASPEQIKAIVNIKSPANAKDVQRLTGRIAALNRFISKSSEKCKEFYDILRKNKKFDWTEKHENALKALKDYLSSAPALMKPEKGDVLSLYLAVSSKAVSAVLVKDHEGTQHPVYYVSKSLLDAESRYSHLEKLILALIKASTKLRHYFESHAIIVKTNFRIKNVLRKPEMSGRMAKWVVKLSAYDIRYEPRKAIKSRALADFVADFSSDLQKEAELEVQQLEETKDPWILYTDGSSNVKGTGLGILLKSLQGDIIPHSIACEFQTTNNEAEHEALIAGLQIAKHMRIRYLEVPREENTEADALANLGSSLKIPEDISIPIIHILTPAIEDHVAMEIGENSAIIPSDDTQSHSGSWILPIMRYIQHGEIPTGENPRAFKIKVSQFTILNNMLYKRSLA